MSKIIEEKVESFRDQKTEEQRFTMRYIFKYFFYNLVHLERKRYLYTAYDLTERPGKAIQRYLVCTIGIIFCAFAMIANAQNPIQSFIETDTDTLGYFARFGKNKQLPKRFEKQTLIALSYFPELVNTKIDFILNNDITPLASIPSVWSVFKIPSDRTYLITISSQSIELLNPILLNNLTYNAQIGVLGHELSHVCDFQTWNLFDFIKHVLKNISSTYLDQFEYNTDKICIDHGLGYQLKAWSLDTRQKLGIKRFMSESDIKNGRERYMNPNTIDRFMAQDTLYNAFKNQ